MSEWDETKEVRLEAILDDSLASTLDVLSRMPESPKVRDLRAKVQTYRQAIQRWAAVRPSTAQRDALRELVLELYTRAIEEQTSEAPTPVLGVQSVRPPERD